VNSSDHVLIDCTCRIDPVDVKSRREANCDSESGRSNKELQPVEIQKEKKVFNITMTKENEKELEEHLEKLHTEEQTVVTRWMHI